MIYSSPTPIQPITSHMKPKTSLRNLILAAATLGLACSAHSAVIYFDDFTTGSAGALNGQNLITPSTATWNASNWQKNTTTNSATNTSNSGSAMVPISFSAGDIIQVTARVINNTTGSSWVAMGFSSGSIASNGSGGRNWTSWRGDEVLRVHSGNATVAFNSDLSFKQAGESNTLDLRAIYDVDAGTISWLYKNPSSSTWTEYFLQTSPTSGMTHVGFANTANNVAVSSFEVINIPEPSTALLGGLGMLFLLRRRR